jgi:hypothetical protein
VKIFCCTCGQRVKLSWIDELTSHVHQAHIESGNIAIGLVLCCFYLLDSGIVSLVTRKIKLTFRQLMRRCFGGMNK